MKHRISVTVNGTAREAEVESRLLLVHFIRENLRLTGTHIGCDTSHCGVCTVLLDGQPVKSCTVLAVQADGCSVSTVEGLEQGGKLHPVQEAFTEKHALQCGYCTPGMLITARDIIARYGEPEEKFLREALAGNICRCTGYAGIVKAVQHAATQLAQRD
jgi:carbon-monoxide dehydrogenase small subunit